MSLTTAKRNFEGYLLTPIERYQVAKLPFSLKPKQDHRKELIFQQHLFLQVAAELQATKPWIAYFAAIKHFRLVAAKDVSTATFNDLRDKEFATEVAAAAEDLRDASLANLDADTTSNLDLLCLLQEVAPLTGTAIKTLTTIAASKHHRAVIEALRGQPPKSGCAIMGGGVALFFVLGIIGSMAGGDSGYALMMLIMFFVIFTAAGLAYYQFDRWHKITALVTSFQTHVAPVAQMLGADPIEWLAHPSDARNLLSSVDATRRQYEELYLNLSE